MDFPALANDIVTAEKIVEAYKPTLDAALKNDFNSKLLAVVPYPSQILFCKDEVRSLKDLKGKKVRASGWTVAEFLDGIGATGITMSYSEVPQALQRGVIDCAVTGGLSGYSSGWGEVANHLYPLPIGGWAYVVTAMNLNTWDKFSKNEKKTLLASINKNITVPAWKKTDYETSEGEKCLTGQDCSYGKANNMVLHKVKTEDTVMAKNILVNNVIPKWVKKVSPKVVKQWNESIGKIVSIEAK